MSTPTRHSTLAQWLSWLSEQHPQEIDLGLARVGEVARRLDVCRPAPWVITVAGTNGKGSSVAMLSAILQAQGFRVGMYTSPHLLRFNERVVIAGECVEDAALVAAFCSIKQACQSISLTYFEYATLAALYLFKDRAVDVAVLEVGLGGRLDAVNIVDADASLLTAIDIDHADWLGSTREAIGFEKAGVMRAQRICVCSDPVPPQSVISYAQSLAVDLRCLGRDFSYSVRTHDWVFKDSGGEQAWPLPALKGAFQIQNAAGVLALLKAQSELSVSDEAIRHGLTHIVHPGRLASYSLNQQAWLLDVAHNPQSVQALAQFLAQQPTGERVAIFAVMADKDVTPMIALMRPFVSIWILPELAVPRAMSAHLLREKLIGQGVDASSIIVSEQMAQALKVAQSLALDQGVVFGSFITVAQALEAVSWMR
ncbi:MAG: bifunctional tetrahydrofolate synthase/dihydrofolate synthase [Thiomicrospira sp.]